MRPRTIIFYKVWDSAAEARNGPATIEKTIPTSEIPMERRFVTWIHSNLFPQWYLEGTYVFKIFFQVSSSGQTTSKLWESNKMLAQLLAQQPKNHQPIPPIPASEITATPQDKLPRITDQNAMNKSLQMNMMNQQNIMNNSRMAAARMPNRAPPTTNYLSNQVCF